MTRNLGAVAHTPMPTVIRFLSVESAIWLALGQLVVACGGQAVNDGHKPSTTGSAGDVTGEADVSDVTGTGSELGAGAGSTETATSSVGSVATTSGNQSESREAALERAARFVNDYGVACEARKQVTFAEGDSTSAFPTRVLQSRGRPGPWASCSEIADPDAKLACMQKLACDFEWWNQLDWSQWSADATVVEIVGLRPEQINVAATKLEALPDPADPNAPRIGLSSFYEQTFTEPAPPGSHDCAYWWYLDPTPEGVVLVLSSPMAGDLEGQLQFYELDLCLTE